MEKGEVAEFLLVSLGYDYHIDGTAAYNRFNDGVEKLYEHLKSYDASVNCKLYVPHHYQFIPEMLCEVLKTYNPA